MRCPCGKVSPDFARFCPACGRPFDDDRGDNGCLTLAVLLSLGVLASIIIYSFQ